MRRWSFSSSFHWHVHMKTNLFWKWSSIGKYFGWNWKASMYFFFSSIHNIISYFPSNCRLTCARSGPSSRTLTKSCTIFFSLTGIKANLLFIKIDEKHLISYEEKKKLKHVFYEVTSVVCSSFTVDSEFISTCGTDQCNRMSSASINNIIPIVLWCHHIANVHIKFHFRLKIESFTRILFLK